MSTEPEGAPTVPDVRDALSALADQCVLCGLCLPHCPTYRLDRVEAESPRGRILQMKALAEDTLAPTPTGQAHLDHCLACRRCEDVCPAKVRYGELLVGARAALPATRPATLAQRMARALVARPALLQFAFDVARLARQLWPVRFKSALPDVPRRRAMPRDRRAAGGPRQGTVALFLGCVSRRFEADALHAAADVLARLGYDVRVPTAQTCCGTLARHAGDAAGADALAARNRRAFAADVDAVLTLDSGCTQALADSLTGPVVEAARFIEAALARRDDVRIAASPRRVALHLPCTQCTVTKGADAVRRLVSRASSPVVVIGEHGCCGAAGSHMIDAPDRAAALRAPLLDAVVASGADTLLSGNVGCAMHLAAGLRQRGVAVDVLHPVQPIAEGLT